jgi:NAD(P)-dependent dehydrogenase (short-subunit alcohol dehydrogenase family)
MVAERVAFVTGASRGIGKAVAVAMAQAGFDVAITARTVEPGEQREHSSTVKQSDTTPLPGSLNETAALIEAAGRQALMAPADITDRASLGAAATLVLERWGRVDVLVNNARFIGPGHMDQLLDTPISAIENHVQGNFFAPLVLIKLLAPAMIQRGSGRIINVTSGSAVSDPLKPAGSGGWGISYGATKAALHRVAGIVAVELESHGILVFNLDPGYITTERIIQDMAKFGFNPDGEPPEVPGAVAAWLATSDEAVRFNGQTVIAQQVCAERNLVPGWSGPKPREMGVRPDPTAARLAAS